MESGHTIELSESLMIRSLNQTYWVQIKNKFIINTYIGSLEPLYLPIESNTHITLRNANSKIMITVSGNKIKIREIPTERGHFQIIKVEISNILLA